MVAAAYPPRKGPVHRAVYGTSRMLGDVEFLHAEFGAHRFAPHMHPVFAVGAVRRGACRIWHRGVSHLAEPGDLILINPGDPHSADPGSADSWEYCAVYFSMETALRWGAKVPASGSALHLGGVVGRDPELAAQLDAICRLLDDDRETTQAEPKFAQLVRGLFTRFGDASAVRSDDGNDSMDAVRRYIEQHFTTVVSIDTLADLAQQSPYHVIRSFSRRYGMPPYTYLTHLRIAHARELLRSGRTITDTAYAVGFTDQSHLTKFFRRIVGVPPGLFVRGIQVDAPAPPSPEPGSPEFLFGA